MLDEFKGINCSGSAHIEGRSRNTLASSLTPGGRHMRCATTAAFSRELHKKGMSLGLLWDFRLQPHIQEQAHAAIGLLRENLALGQGAIGKLRFGHGVRPD